MHIYGILKNGIIFLAYLVAQACRLFATLWTIACQALLSIEFFRKTQWSRLPFPPPEDLPNPGIKPTSPVSPALQMDSLPAEPLGKPPKMI